MITVEELKECKHVSDELVVNNGHSEHAARPN